MSTALPDNAARLGLRQLLLAVAGIYVTQSIITVLITQALPTLLRNEGASLEIAGLTALLWLPWGVRFLWAPYIERWRLPQGVVERRSRRIVLLGQWMMAFILFVIGVVCWFGQLSLVSHIGWILGALLLAAVVAATADIACDGFVVDQLSEGRRGWGNSIQVGGAYLGAMLGSGGFLLLVRWWGWEVALMATGLVILLLTIPMVMTKEPARQSHVETNHQPSLWYALRRPEVRLGLLMLLVSSVGIRLSLGMFGPFLLDKGMSLDQVGWLFGSLYIGAGLGGAVVGGFFVRFVPGWRAVWIAVGVKACVLALLAMAAPTASLSVVTWLVVVMFAVMGVLWVALYSTLMSLASPLQAGVDFTMFQSGDALLAGVAGVLAGWLSQHFGYATCFGLAAVLTLIGTVMVRQQDQKANAHVAVDAVQG